MAGWTSVWQIITGLLLVLEAMRSGGCDTMWPMARFQLPCDCVGGKPRGGVNVTLEWGITHV